MHTTAGTRNRFSAGRLGAPLIYIIGVVLAGRAALSAADAPAFSWQEPQAKVLENGDLDWAPLPFAFEKGASLKYIDFDGGSDDAAGTREQPWKHHPWDEQAAGQAKTCTGIHTYVFKRGVAYRGVLVAKESGQAGDPIRLTSDPSWGSGAAAIYGSERITSGWKKCAAGDAPATMPETEKVWFLDQPKDRVPCCVFELHGDDVERIHIARAPNYALTTPDDPMGDWYEWTGPGAISFVNEDKKNLTQADAHYYDGGYVWSEWYDTWGNMGLPYCSPILDYKPAAHSIRRNKIWFGGAERAHRYYMENLPGFLDSPGEFYSSAAGEHPGRIYLRLPGDRDPNQATVELAHETRALEMLDRHDIAVTGLRFSFLDVPYRLYGAVPPVLRRPTAIRLIGHCQGIRVANCEFFHVPSALRAAPRIGPGALAVRAPELPIRDGVDHLDDLTICDCDVAHADERAFEVRDGWSWNPAVTSAGDLGRIAILRNRARDIGARPDSTYNCPAIEVCGGTLTEIAGNVIDRAWGIGIWMIGGKNGGDPRDRPLIRSLVHHNKVTNALLAANDWGAIAIWQGGPAYVFDNISGNPMGPRHGGLSLPAQAGSDGSCNGFAFYLDGQYKSYVFDNIAWGTRNDPGQWLKNRSAFMMAGPHFQNSWFNNTAYKFTHALTGSGGQRTAFVGNIFDDITTRYINHNAVGDISLYAVDNAKQTSAPTVSTLAYSSNIFFGHPTDFGHVAGTEIMKTLADFRASFEAFKPRAGDVGVEADQDPLAAPDKGDFRPRPGGGAIGRGARLFVPWGLSMTVGEWSFCRFNADPSVVLGENLFMSEEYVERDMYIQVPRNDLSVVGATADDYVQGVLEDWTPGALAFDGKDRYCVLRDRDLKSDYETDQGFTDSKGAKIRSKGRFTYPGNKRRTVDMDVNDFLIEACLKTVPGRAGTLVCKRDATAGYALRIDAQGHASLSLRAGAADAVAAGTSTALGDGNWHHLIAEVDRAAGAVALYVDGKLDARAQIHLAKDASLANTADFLVGKSSDATAPEAFAGAIDFLRLSRGTLADAQTTIAELYAWEFAGPALRDFTGRMIPPGVKRDAGALQSK